MPMLRRPPAHHQNVRTGMRAEVPAGRRAPHDQYRYVMIEIALSTATQRRPFLPFLPLTVASVDGTRSMMLRQRLAIAAAAPNLIPMPAAHASLDRSTHQSAVCP